MARARCARPPPWPLPPEEIGASVPARPPPDGCKSEAKIAHHSSACLACGAACPFGRVGLTPIQPLAIRSGQAALVVQNAKAVSPKSAPGAASLPRLQDARSQIAVGCDSCQQSGAKTLLPMRCIHRRHAIRMLKGHMQNTRWPASPNCSCRGGFVKSGPSGLVVCRGFRRTSQRGDNPGADTEKLRVRPSAGSTSVSRANARRAPRRLHQFSSPAARRSSA